MTDDWGLTFPIVGAPMAGVGAGALAAAVSRAGGLGVIGIGSRERSDDVTREAATARAGGRFGIGLMVWALKERPDLIDAAIAAEPFLLSLSFGDPEPYVARCHAAGILVATQVGSRQAAASAQAAGVDVLVAQGTEAGGHTGQVGTLPLLQIVLEIANVPVIAAGGIASPQGMAAILAAGAAGVWMGTAFLASLETKHSDAARERILHATETDTVHTHLFDRLQALSWPESYPGRALRNGFTDRWHGRQDLPREAQHEFHGRRGDYEVDYIYAGQAVGLVNAVSSAADIVRRLGHETERWLRQRTGELLHQKEDH